MPQTFENYLPAEVSRIGRREKLSDDKAFLFWFAVNVLELSEDDAREAMSVEGANDKGIDLFWVDDDEGRIIIAQGKYSKDFTFRPKIGEVTKLQSSLNWMASPEAIRRDGKHELAQAAEDYLTAVKEGAGTELWFVYTGTKCPNIDKHVGVYNQNPENIEKRRSIRHYYTDLLKTSWEELEGASRRIEQEEMEMASNSGLPFDGTFGKALVATIPGSEIVKLYEKHEDRLFDRNVRLFLGVRKGSVNASIAETLSDPRASQNFWAFNNGITVVCDFFLVKDNKITLKNFSIVNGCQTAVSLSQGNKEKVSKTAVLVKFIAASPDIVDDVIRFTNSQNPIRTWDIASQDKTQRRLKNAFEKLNKPYIYLTRRGTRPTGDLKKYRDENGKLRQIRIDIVGQYAAAFRGDPVLAYKHKAYIFSRQHDDVFPPDAPVEEVLFRWVCGEVVREAVQESISKKKESEVRILKKGGTLFVIAVLSKILSLRNGAAYLKGCTEQHVIGTKMRQRLHKYAEYARDVYVQAVIDQGEIEKTELATLIRQPEFYKKVIERVDRQYARDARAAHWVKEALPSITLSD